LSDRLIRVLLLSPPRLKPAQPSGRLVPLVMPPGREAGYSPLPSKEHKNTFSPLPFALSWQYLIKRWGPFCRYCSSLLETQAVGPLLKVHLASRDSHCIPLHCHQQDTITIKLDRHRILTFGTYPNTVFGVYAEVLVSCSLSMYGG